MEAIQSGILNPESGKSDGIYRLQPAPQSAQAMLGQNLPNPFNNATIIPFRIPEACQSAVIIIAASTGSVLRAIPVSCKETQLSLEAGTLAPGVYTYSLSVDGITVDTKRMILTEK